MCLRPDTSQVSIKLSIVPIELTLTYNPLVAAATLCMYDWALVWTDEYELVGKSRLSMGKVLYYFVSPLVFALIGTHSRILQQSRVLTPFGLAFALYRGLSLKSPLLSLQRSLQICRHTEHHSTIA